MSPRMRSTSARREACLQTMTRLRIGVATLIPKILDYLKGTIFSKHSVGVLATSMNTPLGYDNTCLLVRLCGVGIWCQTKAILLTVCGFKKTCLLSSTNTVSL